MFLRIREKRIEFNIFYYLGYRIISNTHREWKFNLLYLYILTFSLDNGCFDVMATNKKYPEEFCSCN